MKIFFEATKEDLQHRFGEFGAGDGHHGPRHRARRGTGFVTFEDRRRQRRWRAMRACAAPAPQAPGAEWKRSSPSPALRKSSQEKEG